MAAEFKPVELIDPNGQTYTAESAIELNDLIYGRGYRLASEVRKSTKKVEEDK